MIFSPLKNGSIVAPILILLYGIILWANVLFSSINLSFFEFGLLNAFIQDIDFEARKVGINLFSFFTILLTGFLYNRAIDKDEFFPKNTFFPLFFYTMLMSLPDQQRGYSPVVFANLFLLLYFIWCIKIKRQDDAREIIFNGGFFLSAAILLFPVYIPLAISPFILLLIFRPFVWREWALAILGLAVPALFYFSYLYLNDIDFASNTYLHGFNATWGYIKLPDTFDSVFSALLVFIVLISLFTLNKVFLSSSLRLRKFIQFFIFNLILFSMINVSVYSYKELALPIIALPLSLFLSYYFFYAKAFWGNLFFYLLIAMSIYSIYFA